MDNQEIFVRKIRDALIEDIGKGDLTTDLTITEEKEIVFNFTAREEIVVCGLPMLEIIFNMIKGEVKFENKVQEGSRVKPKEVIATVSGDAKAILRAERVALNFLQRMSAVATITSKYVEAVKGTDVKILDTRKTMPGLREFDKYAVKIGGGHNHRMRLDDGILIKDNHIAFCGGIREALIKAKEKAPSNMNIEIECETLGQVLEAVSAGADIIMLDNMSPANMMQAVSMVGGKAKIEASGNINLDNVLEVAKTGVDYISIGKITSSAPNVDIGLDVRSK